MPSRTKLPARVSDDVSAFSNGSRQISDNGSVKRHRRPRCNDGARIHFYEPINDSPSPPDPLAQHKTAMSSTVDNAAEGVRCSAGAKGRLERNTIQNNGGAGGILAEAGCEPTVGENYLDELHVQGDEGP